MTSDSIEPEEDSDPTDVYLGAPPLPNYIQLAVSQPLAEQLMLTLDRHETSLSSHQSLASDRQPTNISIKNSDKENKTINYLDILDIKFNKRGRGNKTLT